MTNRVGWACLLAMAILSFNSRAAFTTVPAQTVKLNDHLALEFLSRQTANASVADIVLRARGKEVARVDSSRAVIVFRGETPPAHSGWFRWDVDGDGKRDWLLAFSWPTKPGWMEGAASVTLYWPESEQSAIPPYAHFCENLGAVIVSGDEQRMWVVNYSYPFRPLATSALGIMLPEQAKGIIGAAAPKKMLQSQPELTEAMWQAIAGKLNGLCGTNPNPKETSSSRLPVALPPRLPWGEPRWEDYLPSALKMYEKAQARYQYAILQGGPEYRTRGISIFNFSPFFEAFLFDEVDPQHRYPAYTAMLNDHAYATYLRGLDELRDCIYNVTDPKRLATRKQDDIFYAGRDKRAPRTDWSVEGYCEEGFRPYRREVIPMLKHVIERDPNRAVAYLNLADAQWEVPEQKEIARTTYRRYIEVLHKTKPKAKPAKQALERAIKAS